MNAFQHTLVFHRENAATEHLRVPLTVLPESAFSHIVENHVIGIYPDFRLQTVEGFGCALTETACYLLSRMTPEQRRETLSLWFGPENTKARFVRVSIDSCDYSLSEYQAVPDPIADPELNTFSLARDRQYILPVLKEAVALSGGQLRVLLSPWSPPWQWKTPPLRQKNDASAYGGQETDASARPSRNNGGSLKPEFYGAWANYLVKYIQGYLDEGIPVTMLSVQNESAAATPWDSCVWTGEQEKVFLRDHLFPALRRAGLDGQIELFIWDHNKERMIENVTEMMDKDTEDMIRGFAYHWYTGDHFEALSLLHGRYPDKVLMHSESCPLHMPGRAVSADLDPEILKKKPRASLAPEELAVLTQENNRTPADIDLEDAFTYAHDMIGDLNHGMNRWIDWNLIVDQTGGPRHVPGGFAAPLVDLGNGRVLRTPAYEWLRLIMEHVPAGSVRIGCSSYGPGTEATAVLDPEGCSLHVLLFHHAASEEEINLRLLGHVITVTCPPESLTAVRVELHGAE